MSGWDTLASIFREATQEAIDERNRPELSCPLCGEPLRRGHCTFDGYQSQRSGATD